MTKPNDPVFSTEKKVTSEGVYDNPPKGLTKREYFAAMALQGILANEGTGNCDTVCRTAIYHADELIRQLNPRHT